LSLICVLTSNNVTVLNTIILLHLEKNMHYPLILKPHTQLIQKLSGFIKSSTTQGSIK